MRARASVHAWSPVCEPSGPTSRQGIYLVMADIVAHVAIAHTVIAHVVMPHTVVVHMVMARIGTYSHGTYR